MRRRDERERQTNQSLNNQCSRPSVHTRCVPEAVMMAPIAACFSSTSRDIKSGAVDAEADDDDDDDAEDADNVDDVDDAADWTCATLADSDCCCVR